jgi:hypothetical protein
MNKQTQFQKQYGAQFSSPSLFLSNKKGELMQKQVVYVIIGVLACFLILAFHLRFFGFFTNEPSDIVNCQQSLLLASTALTRGIHDISAMPIKCPANVIDIKSKNLEKVPSSQKVEYERLLDEYPVYQNVAQYNVDSQMWAQANTCYQRVFYGKRDLFSRSIFGDDDKFCIVCAVFYFDEDVQGLVQSGNVAPLLVERNVSATQSTLLDLAYDHPHIAIGNIDLSYTTNQPVAIIYERTNAIRFSQFYVDAYVKISDWYYGIRNHVVGGGLDKPQVTIQPDGSVSYNLANSREIRVSDFEMIRAIPYTKEGLSDCTVLVSEVLVNGKTDILTQ